MLELDIKSNIFDRSRKLIINSELVEFDDSDGANIPPTQFSQGEIAALKFGVQFIHGYVFTIGRKYCIDIKGIDNRVIKIRLVSLYGIRRKALYEKYSQILTTFFNTHQEDIINYHLELFNGQNEINILGTSFRNSGIIINGKEIAWENLGTKAYTTYYALFSKEDPSIYKSYSYLEDWNTAMVHSLSRQILFDRGLLE